MDRMQIVYHAMDWLSIKLTLVSGAIVLLSANKAMQSLYVIVLVSTLVYNGIRIYKELKNKNNVG